MNDCDINKRLHKFMTTWSVGLMNHGGNKFYHYLLWYNVDDDDENGCAS